MKLRKFWPLIGAICACFCSFAHAEDYGTPQPNCPVSPAPCPKPCPPRPCPKPKPCCPKPNPCCPKPQGTYQRGTYREITPCAGPRVNCGADVFITADFIWWKLTQDGMAYAQTGVGVANPSKGNQKDPDFGWEPGFRVGLGLNFNHDCWDLYAEYTWLNSTSSSSTEASNSVLATFNTNAHDINHLSDNVWYVDRATGDQKTRYNVINLELGRNFYVSQFLMIRPHFGFTGTWQRVNYNVRYFGDFVYDVHDSDPANNATFTVTDGRYRMRHRNRYWGVGIRSGLDTAWHFTTQWSVYGDVAWAAMWSCYDLSLRSDAAGTINQVANSSNVVTRLCPPKYYSIKFYTEFEIGLRWEMWFCNDDYHFAIQAGWAETIWINHMMFLEPGVRDFYGDMSLHGLDIKLRFDF